MMGGTLPDDGETPAQIVADVIAYHAGEPSIRLRHSSKLEDQKKTKDDTAADPVNALLPDRLMQSDNAYELLRICAMQKIDADFTRQLILAVFDQHSPKGAAAQLAGKDTLDPNRVRAPKCSLAFQKYRIIDTVSNLRADNGRRLTVDEKHDIVNMLMGDNKKATKYTTWGDVTDVLGHQRSWLKGVGQTTPDNGERVSGRPPHITVLKAINSLKDPEGSPKDAPHLRDVILEWWADADDEDREALVLLLSNTVGPEQAETDPRFIHATGFLTRLDDLQLELLDGMNLEAGRAAYSEHTLNRLSAWMLDHEGDVTDAREALFHVSRDWRPPQEPVGAPIGNPAADRTVKFVARWLAAIARRYGRPDSVQIEHVRDGFSSTVTARKQAREYERRTSQRWDRKAQVAGQLEDEQGILRPSEADLRRQEAINAQGGVCLYCGADITFHTCEMDHIVPRKGEGSTNTRDNLVAVCPRCNREKSSLPFPVYCRTDMARARGITVEGAVRRARRLAVDSKTYPGGRRALINGIIRRLRQTQADEPIDGRSLESTAWMANELHKRIEYAFNNPAGEYYKAGTPVTVNVYRGRLTAEARQIMRHAAGTDFHMIGGHGKTRLDRRHHAIDASVIAMMTPAAAQAIAERLNLRDEELETGRYTGWKTYPQTPSEQYRDWEKRMIRLIGLLNDALDADRVHVTRSQRYQLGNSSIHKDTIHPLESMPLGGAISETTLLHASTPALYTALTHLPDYVAGKGLPADPDRRINVNGRILTATDTIRFFNDGKAQILVRGGGAEVGSSIHHARVYRYYTENRNGERRYAYGWVRVYSVDLLHAKGSLFTEPLKPCSLSLRYTSRKLADAILHGRAEYLGYVLINDELTVDFPSDPASMALSGFDDFFAKDIMEQPKAMSRWIITGFVKPEDVSIRPAYLAGEGLKNMPEAIGKTSADSILNGSNGLTVSVNQLFALHPTIIRRNTLGEEIHVSKTGKTTSWHAD